MLLANFSQCMQVYGTQLLALGRSEGPPPPLEVGFTHELCAGIIDKDKPLEEIAAEEVGWGLRFH